MTLPPELGLRVISRFDYADPAKPGHRRRGALFDGRPAFPTVLGASVSVPEGAALDDAALVAVILGPHSPLGGDVARVLRERVADEPFW